MDRLFFDSSAGKISYMRRAGGRNLLLIHGFTASADIWKEMVNYLDESFNVISVDLFGHGKSEMPKMKSIDLNLKQLIEAQSKSILELLSHLGAKTYFAVGSSFGGLIAMNLAVSSFRPERVVLIDSAGMTPNSDKRFISGLKILMDEHSKSDMIFPFPLGRLMEAVDKDEIRIDNSLVKNIKIPVSVIWGSEDYIFDPKWGKELSNAFPLSEFHVIKGANHTPFTTHPQIVADMINKFLLTPTKQ